MRRIVGPILSPSAGKLLLVIALAGVVSCITPPPPYEDFTIAKAAIRAAEEVDAVKFAPAVWAKAEESYRNAQMAYKDRDYGDAKKFFRQTVKYAEQAEEITRLKKFESGDSFP